MSDPNYMHEFDGNLMGLCKTIIGSRICHQPEDAEIHQRYVKSQVDAQTEADYDAMETLDDGGHQRG